VNTSPAPPPLRSLSPSRTGIDYTHPDLYANVWINQGEIPAAQKAKILANYDYDHDGKITFRDLNSPLIQGQWDSSTVVDVNHDGRIDASDVLPVGRRHGQRRQRLCR